MNIWSKLLTALRGGANEVGETIVDSQALRILDQEIREAGSELQTSKEALAGLMAKHMLANVNVTDTQSTIHEHEQHVIKALAAGDESLATEVAHRIAALETELPVKQKPGCEPRFQRRPTTQSRHPGAGTPHTPHATGGAGQGDRKCAASTTSREQTHRQLSEQPASCTPVTGTTQATASGA